MQHPINVDVFAQTFFQLFHSDFLSLYILLVARPASTSFHRYWPYKNFCWLVWFQTCPKNNAARRACKYRRWGLGGEAITRLRWWYLKNWPLWGKTADDEKFECFWLEAFLLHQNFSRRSKVERLQLYWPCLDNSQFENDTSIAPGPTWPDESSSSSCL